MEDFFPQWKGITQENATGTAKCESPRQPSASVYGRSTPILALISLLNEHSIIKKNSEATFGTPTSTAQPWRSGPGKSRFNRPHGEVQSCAIKTVRTLKSTCLTSNLFAWVTLALLHCAVLTSLLFLPMTVACDYGNSSSCLSLSQTCFAICGAIAQW